jgi:acyl-homoserine-lactone acylase
VAAPWDAKKGYVGQLPHGSSFIQVVQFDGDGCPDTRTILTYSQSTNPRSPWSSDQTRMFARKQWVAFPFTAAQIRAAKVSRRTVSAPR